MADSERTRGDKWAEFLERRGAWVQKLPASSLAGLPDWLVVSSTGAGSRLVEAKVLQTRGAAFVPSQCTGAQRFFLEAVARHGGQASILILGPDGFYEEIVDPDVGVVEIPRIVFEAGERGYGE